jgi:hypothetical protein
LSNLEEENDEKNMFGGSGTAPGNWRSFGDGNNAEVDRRLGQLR